MSNTMSLAPTGLLAVDCVTCKRRIRVSDTADAPHMSALRSLGWVLTDQGKWQCDECVALDRKIGARLTSPVMQIIMGKEEWAAEARRQQRQWEAEDKAEAMGGADPAASLEPGWVHCPQGCGIVVEECELCVHCSVCPRCCACGHFVPRSDAQASPAQSGGGK